jgi:hypothetical protein
MRIADTIGDGKGFNARPAGARTARR